MVTAYLLMKFEVRGGVPVYLGCSSASSSPETTTVVQPGTFYACPLQATGKDYNEAEKALRAKVARSSTFSWVKLPGREPSSGVVRSKER